MTVFLICSTLCCFEPGSLLEPASWELRLASQRDHPKLCNYRLAQPFLALSLDARDLNWGLHVFMTSILLVELSPQPLGYPLIKKFLK